MVMLMCSRRRWTRRLIEFSSGCGIVRPPFQFYNTIALANCQGGKRIFSKIVPIEQRRGRSTLPAKRRRGRRVQRAVFVRFVNRKAVQITRLAFGEAAAVLGDGRHISRHLVANVERFHSRNFDERNALSYLLPVHNLLKRNRRRNGRSQRRKPLRRVRNNRLFQPL